MKSADSETYHRSFSIRSVGIVLCIVIVCALVGITLWQLQKMQVEVETSQHTAVQLQSEISMLNAQVLSLKESQQKLVAARSSLDEWLSDSNEAKEKRTLVIAEYLIRQAQLNATFSGDIAGAIILLREASHVLANIDGSEVGPIKQALAGTIVRFLALPSIRVENVLSQIDALRGEIIVLQPFVPPMLTYTQPTTQSMTDHNIPRWRMWLRTFVNGFKGFVIVHRHNEAYSPLLAPHAEVYLHENMDLLLLQTKWAVLNRNTSVYQSSLDQVENALERYFSQNPKTFGLRQAIAELRRTDISPVTPDLTPLLHNIATQLVLH